MNCPICNETLNSGTVFTNHYNYSCDTRVILNPILPSASHYLLNSNINQHIMIVMPYRIITTTQLSLIQKHNGNGKFNTLLNTQDLHLEPIQPASEKELINRIETILVFS